MQVLAEIVEQAVIWFPEAAVTAFDRNEHPAARIVAGMVTVIAAAVFLAMVVGVVHLIMHGI